LQAKQFDNPNLFCEKTSMATLREPQKSIPGGFVFLQPETKWSPPPFSSLDSIVQQLIQHRKGRPDLIQKYGWHLDPAVVYQEVMAYNVAKCQQMGWTDYLIGSAEAIPFHPSRPRNILQKVRDVAGGAEVLIDWIKSGEEAVPVTLANKRAAICVACPMNKPGGLEAVFTVPIANAIHAAMQKRLDMKLTTEHDDKLHVCEACSCPLALKVFLPLDRILSKLKPTVQQALHPSCWILNRDA
jgi:hypothetical protein